ncbi:hypothetical protein M2137_001698 [Parabacteroides sp. PFB2-10]|uniref:YjbH domain-containing protein n=1 Tax=Parabacteroides sp. PFB2-10 TaxID=1742405 RepID=UPI002472F1ED|nr:YjbH domain-containing protein [Parabacteroides sp. PFB2-10]MDH6312913.1 hypothetical protein [Parabacteroides sp. PFB2-10]
MRITKRVALFIGVGLACMFYAAGQSSHSTRLDLFSGVELNYRNIHHNNRIYDLLINLTPGLKWHLKNDWMVAAQGYIPVYNQYGDHYKKVRLNMAVLSKEVYGHNQFFKFSGGLFSHERYGLDVKWMFPATSWLAFDAQVGLTGFCSMAVDWESSRMERLTGWLGTKVYLEKYNTEFRLRGGRYIYEDWGVTGECMRHFKHCTVGLYAQYSDKGKENGGFKIIMMIPPYRRKTKTVNFRPASHFRLTNNFQADPYMIRSYHTDPEENEREGSFNREKLTWGSNRMEPDFKEGGMP